MPTNLAKRKRALKRLAREDPTSFPESWELDDLHNKFFGEQVCPAPWEGWGPLFGSYNRFLRNPTTEMREEREQLRRAHETWLEARRQRELERAEQKKAEHIRNATLMNRLSDYALAEIHSAIKLNRMQYAGTITREEVIMPKESHGEMLDRWKREELENAAAELHKIDLLFPGLSNDLRGAIYQGLIATHRTGRAKGRVEIGH